MKTISLTVGLLLLACGLPVVAQSAYYPQSAEWMRKAEEATPRLITQTARPVRLVRPVKDGAAFQEWRMEDAGTAGPLFQESFKSHPTVTLDFGDHYTGYLTFGVEPLRERMAADAPVRLRFTLAEVPAELNTPLEPYKGSLARSWIQDEVVTLTSVPAEVTIPRRLSGRYLKIELLGVSGSFDFKFSKLELRAQTSAAGEVPELSQTTDSLLREIYRVGVKTLRECMQTVYEDGPKRDRRLWIGDLYLEALANAYTFKNHGLTKRCLYLLAACAADDGFLHATVLEEPRPHPQYGTHTLDYALIYNVALLDYLKATGDRATAEDLWPVVGRQIEIALKKLTPQWIYDIDHEPHYWLVFDWKPDFDRQASMQGLMIWALRRSYELAEALGKTGEPGVSEWPRVADKMRRAARERLWDRERQVVLSGRGGQVSYLSQVWMILSGTLSQKEGRAAMRRVMSMPQACYPGCPYAYHYVIEALLRCGMEREARRLLTDYWGGMVRCGADTFWEVYDPNDDTFSPYGFHPINSYCHAWSCTPVYFIARYPEVFQAE